MNKLNWDVYFITQAFLVSQKSIDTSTKCGAILVSKKNRILSVGYNGPLQGVDDSKIPLERPAKYTMFLHSEENCLLSYNGDEYQIENSRIYITGIPCHKCLRMIIQKGIKKIIYANVTPFCCIEEEDKKSRSLMLELKPEVKLIEFKKMDKVKELLKRTIDYIDFKSK